MAGRFLLGLLSLSVALGGAVPLKVLFYKDTCPGAELISRDVMEKHLRRDPTIAAGIIRMFFHDCFVRGCDGSVLLDTTGDTVAEKEAPPNLTLRGFEVIDDIKAALERKCRGTVSCADVLAMAARDSVALSGGAAYEVPTGRRDGVVSDASEVHLPGPSFSILEAIKAFEGINLTVVDLVTLLGAHSIGLCHCGFFVDRLYSFQGTGMPDPSLDAGFLVALRQRCPDSAAAAENISADPTVFMNQATSSPFTLDSSFYRGVLHNRAVLQLDQELAYADLSNSLAATFLTRPNLFIWSFSKSMIRLGNVGVLSGDQGEIRLNCRQVNGVA